jgi:regulator of protease activity HflC (stomatin/prohibitin superfamily)
MTYPTIAASAASNEPAHGSADHGTSARQRFSFKPPRLPGLTPKVLMLLAGAALVVIAANPIVIVPAGHRGVLTTFGKVDQEVLGEGLHFLVPVAQKVHLMNVQILKGDGRGEAASKDLQHVSVTAAINYRIDPAKTAVVFQTIGSINAVHEAVKASVAGFTAEELVTRRTEVRQRIRDQLDQRLQTRGVIVEDFAIVEFRFSKEFEAAIEEKSKAEQMKLKAERDLERVKVEAEQQLAKARADAETLALQRKAEAESLALQRTQITPELLKWEAVRRWDGKLPQIVGSGASIHIPMPPLPSGK